MIFLVYSLTKSENFRRMFLHLMSAHPVCFSRSEEKPLVSTDEYQTTPKLMKLYELMFIVPGTLTEEEVAPQVAALESLVQTIGGTELQTKALGKAKLAYPMNHIRYGYFYTISFSAEPTKVPDLQRQLNLQKGYLRTIINVAVDTTRTRDNAPDTLITIEKKQDLIDERKKSFARYKEESTPVQSSAPKKVHTPEPTPEITQVATSASKEVSSINMEDIDKKLDGIIAGDDISLNV